VKSSLPAIMKMTVLMVDRRVKPRARRLAVELNAPALRSDHRRHLLHERRLCVVESTQAPLTRPGLDGHKLPQGSCDENGDLRQRDLVRHQAL